MPLSERPAPLPRGQLGKLKDVGGVGSLVSFWTWPALEAACARGCPCALVLVPGVRAGARHSRRVVVHRGQVPSEVAVGDGDASVLEPALPRPPRGPARLALLNLGLVELLEVRLDDRAVGFCCFACSSRQEWDNQGFFFEKAQCRFRALRAA